MSRPKGLGRGIGALLPKKTTSKEVKNGKTIITTTTELQPPKIKLNEQEAAEKAQALSGKVIHLPLASVHANPNQPRKVFDEAALEELADSLRAHGVIQPILVREDKEGYEIIAGERRYRAAQLAKLPTIPAIVGEYSANDRAEIALIENLQREDLNVIEEAHAYDEIIRLQRITQDQLAQKVGRSRSHINNIMRLLRLPARVQECLSQEIISTGQARPLLALDDAALQQETADYIIDNDLSAREVEKLIKKLLKDAGYLETLKNPAPPEEEKKQPQDIFVAEAEDKLKLFFGTQVHIQRGKKKNCIEIEYYSDDDLNRILEAVAAKHENEVERKKAALRQFSQKLNV